MKKNIIYIHTHDSGKILSPYGYDVPTPNLQEFAQNAVLFRNAFCAAPTCSPSRAALLTGLYPHSNGMLGLAQRGFTLNDYSKHMVHFLKENGFHTVLCGIQHEAASYLDHEEAAQIIGYDENITTVNTNYTEEELVEWDLQNAQRIREWLKNKNTDKPFFLSYGLFATHRKFPKKGLTEINPNYVSPPFPIPDLEETREDYADYLNSATWFDASFKIVIDTLKETGLYDDSIIIFTTDHGVAFPFSKCNLTDSGIAVSLIMRVPGKSTAGTVVDSLVSQVDIFPTLCDLIGLEKPKHLQGVSFAEVFTDSKSEVRKEVFAEINFHTSYEPARSIRTKRYKYIRYFDEDFLKINISNIDASKTKDFYLEHELREKEKPKEALYDLYYDVGERNNLVEDPAYLPILQEMRETLKTYQEKTNDPLLTGHIAIKENWKVNTKECIHPSSKDPKDYVNK
ncbi:sulfatase [Lederbergia graminis]|uniref:Sulfatase n=1 Tax=Lederbergia graminis TaxID=735518 RepID=A0ABW0LNI1_9BACI